jgi:CRP-like cAMP-binding protein
MDDFWRRHGFDWLAELSERDAERLLSRSSSRQHARGETVFEPSVDPPSVYLLETGLVRIYRLSAKGAEATLGYVRPGELFGELEAISDRPRESFAQAVLPSRVWPVPRLELRRLLGSHPSIAFRVAEQVANRFKRIESRVESLVLKSLSSRVGLILLELAEDFGRAAADGLCIDLPLSQNDVAMLVGATRQSVNICLQELCEKQLLIQRKHRFTLPDPVALRAAIQD